MVGQIWGMSGFGESDLRETFLRIGPSSQRSHDDAGPTAYPANLVIASNFPHCHGGCFDGNAIPSRAAEEERDLHLGKADVIINDRIFEYLMKTISKRSCTTCLVMIFTLFDEPEATGKLVFRQDFGEIGWNANVGDSFISPMSD
jgi:hypothetical protein